MSNFIQDLEITNLKSIRHQKIEGCKRVNVFIGYPSVGKSNILEAIGSLGIVEKVLEQNLIPKFLLSDFIRLETLPTLFFQGVLNDSPAVIQSSSRIISFVWDDFTGSLRYACRFDPQLVLSTTFDNDLKPTYTSLSDSFRSDEPPTNAEILALLHGHVYKYSFNSILRKADSRITKAGLQFPFGENIASVIQLNPQLRREASVLFSEYDFDMVFDNGNLRLQRKIDEHTVFSLGIQSTADTLQRLIFHKAAIASNNDTVLIFEDPEAHMFPPYIKLFTNDIVEKKSNQFFIATHSPVVLKELMEHAREELNVYTVALEEGETKIKRITDEELADVEKYSVDLFFNLESYL